MSSTPQSQPLAASAVDTAPPAKGETTKQKQSDTARWDWLGASPSKLAAATAFGIIFGFLLQKGGAATFDILIGVLLLENFVVVKIMLSAIIVGMVGSYFLRRAGIVELQINETKYGANIIGGLIFGAGFALLAYCPGTNAAAIGQGNLDALIGVIGLVAGSYVFALTSKFSSGTVSQWGKAGKITLPELMKVPTGWFIAAAAPALIGFLVVLELFGL